MEEWFSTVIFGTLIKNHVFKEFFRPQEAAVKYVDGVAAPALRAMLSARAVVGRVW